MKINLQKFIAASGHCSRRKAGDLIKEKKIKVNGKLAELGMKVDENDKVEVVAQNRTTVLNYSPEQPENLIYIKLNKPIGYTCTNRKFKGEKNIFELLTAFPQNTNRLFAAGRLDKNSRGLVLLTNDGDLVQKLTHPSFGHEKEYLVSIIPTDKGSASRRRVVKTILEKFQSGIRIPDGMAKAKEIKYLNNNKFSIILTMGKKRQIREMFKKMGYDVKDLQRVRIGGLKLGDLKEGGFEVLSKQEAEDLTAKT
ncbi:MAG: pseudouridine synthase [bacterium]